MEQNNNVNKLSRLMPLAAGILKCAVEQLIFGAYFKPFSL